MSWLFYCFCLPKAVDHLESFIAECDRRTELAKKRLAETQEEISAEVAAKVSDQAPPILFHLAAVCLHLKGKKTLCDTISRSQSDFCPSCYEEPQYVAFMLNFRQRRSMSWTKKLESSWPRLNSWEQREMLTRPKKSCRRWRRCAQRRRTPRWEA